METSVAEMTRETAPSPRRTVRREFWSLIGHDLLVVGASVAGTALVLGVLGPLPLFLGRLLFGERVAGAAWAAGFMTMIMFCFVVGGLVYWLGSRYHKAKASPNVG